MSENTSAVLEAVDKKAPTRRPPKICRPVEFADGEDGNLEVTEDHTDERFGETIYGSFGVPNYQVYKRMLAEVTDTLPMRDRAKADEVNYCIALLHEIAPQNGVEGMLAAQMVGTHNLAMSYLRRAATLDMPLDRQSAYNNMATKLTRTFVAQVEALKKLRSGASQTVEVKHIHVNEGGQAIVGNVQTGGGGGNDKK